MARNVYNQDEITQELKDFMDCCYEDFDGYAAIEDQSVADKCTAWLTTVARNHLLATLPGKRIKRTGPGMPDWAKAALKRGDELIRVEISATRYNELCGLVEYIALSGISDVARLSYPQALIQRKKFVEERAAAKKKELERIKALGGALPVCTFSDGLKLVELKTGDAVRDEAKRQKNCLANYARRVEHGDYRVFSIRDQADKSIISIGLDDDNELDDVKETCNSEVRAERREHVRLALHRIGAKQSYLPKYYKTKQKIVVVKKEVVLPGLYARNDKSLTSLESGEYKGNVDISGTSIKSLPANSVFHGHIYAQGLKLNVPKSTVVHGKIYS
jgi:DNA-binding transcriptional MerR regulator